MSEQRKKTHIGIETANYGIVGIEIKEFENWFFNLTADDLIRLDFTVKEYNTVKKIFLKNELDKTYSPLVYDFAVSMLNQKIDEGRVVFERHFF